MVYNERISVMIDDIEVVIILCLCYCLRKDFFELMDLGDKV